MTIRRGAVSRVKRAAEPVRANQLILAMDLALPAIPETLRHR